MLQSTWSQHNFWTNQDRCSRLVPHCCKLNFLLKVLIFFDVCMTFLSMSSWNRQWCYKWPISITTTITIFKKMHFSKIFPTKYFAVCFFEILDACCRQEKWFRGPSRNATFYYCFFPVWQILEEINMKIFILKQISKYFWRIYTFN